MRLDVDRLTCGEIATLEDLSGQPITAVSDVQAPKGKLIAALVYVQSRRDASPKKWDQCLAMPFTEASDYLGLGDDEDEDGLDDEENELAVVDDVEEGGLPGEAFRKPEGEQPAAE